MARILLTGGAGYIGSHTYLGLVEAGHEVVILDNFTNARDDVPERLERISGRPATVYRGDVLDRALLDRIFADQAIDGVVHFAALKAVGESVQKPLDYIHTNVGGLLTLLAAMEAAGVRCIVFSSSATVYGDTNIQRIPEDHPRSHTSPYGYTKITGETALEQVAAADARWAVGILRYFNPVGAHRSALIGEDPGDIPNNLMPYIAKVATGELRRINVFGDDYNTPDGTGVRDYIHVMDLAEGHVRAVETLGDNCGCVTYNLGTGRGYSVLEMIAAFEKACGRKIPYRITGRRPGDIARCWADPSLAQRELGWQARYGIEQMCEDTWRWQSMNPQGYGGV